MTVIPASLVFYSKAKRQESFCHCCFYTRKIHPVITVILLPSFLLKKSRENFSILVSCCLNVKKVDIIPPIPNIFIYS